MRVGDKSEYDDEDSEDEQNEIERISLNKAVEELQAKLDITRNYSTCEIAVSQHAGISISYAPVLIKN